MSAEHPADPKSMSLAVASLVEVVCQRFEAAWKAGQRPGIEGYLKDAQEAARSALLRELVALDIEYRCRLGERFRPGDYRHRFPDLDPEWLKEWHRQCVECWEGEAPAEPVGLPGDDWPPPPGTSAEPTTDSTAVPTGGGPTTAGLPTVAGYKVLEELGHGGMGVVYKAWDGSLKRFVALKMMRRGGDVEERARFKLEAEAVARLQHANIVQIHEVGEADGRPYCALEFVEGGSLAQKLGGQPLPPREAARLVATLAEAMQLAHSRNIIHRDLKPANILLAADGTPKVSDFGLARQLDTDSSLTATGAVVGTPSYMSPEQASGRHLEVGPATDVYALGAILFECLTGRPPFQAATSLDTLDKVRREEPMPPSRWNPKVPRDLETVCLKCLRKEPEKRYASAQELGDDLRRFGKGEPVRARPVGLGERAAKWVRRRPVVAALLGLVVLVAAAGLGGVLWAYGEAVRERNNAQAEADNARRAKEAAEAERQKGRLLLARLSLGQGQSLCERDETGRGILWQAHALELIPEEDNTNLRRAVCTSLAAWRSQIHPLQNIWTHPVPIQLAALWRGEWPGANGVANGLVVLTAGTDHKARLWDAASGKSIGEPLRHLDQVLAASFRPDGMILTGCADGLVRLWQIGNDQPQTTYPLGDDPALALAFSATGRFVAVGKKGTVQLWELGEDTGCLLDETDHQEVIEAVAVSADGKAVVVGSADGTVRLWERSAGKPRDLCKHRWGVRAVAFSPDGQFILTGGEDYKAGLWERATGHLVGERLKHLDAVSAVAFDRTGQILLTGSDDGTTRLWQAPPGQPVKPLGSPLEHRGPVRTVAFSPDGGHVLTGDQDQTVRLWKVSSAAPYLMELRHQDPVMAVAFRPDGNVVATGTKGGSVRRWEIKGRKELTPLPMRHEEEIWSLAFSPDGQSILTGSRDKTARLWDSATGKELQLLKHDDAVRSVAFSRDGQTILTGSGNMDKEVGMARLWKAGKSHLDLQSESEGVVWAVAFGKDQTCAVASGTNTVRVWDTSRRTFVTLPTLHGNRVVALSFSRDGRFLLTGSTDRTARLWDAATGNPVGSPLSHPEAVWAVAFNRDGSTLVTGSQDGGVRLWDAATGTLLGPPLWHEDVVWAVACHPEDNTVLTGSDDGTARLWPIPSPVNGQTARIVLWTQVMTAMELDDNGVVRPLDVPTWQERHQRLEELGGPPLP
jgi:WD40 repeat protein